ncbi:MAG: YidC/Oxa1 family membrane protein insertase [Treponema sp.]|jgi:YidC/Oxa1 family membrane protein insertase|nr:YidC/Oxa1 family membrane protein insertase [Treponema sp.]
MLDMLYTLIIFPLTELIELCYFFVYRVGGRNPGIALFGVSLAVSVLTLPLYFRAEKWQDLERELQKRMAPKIKKIKAVFSGDEQYLILSTYYRQNHYHPVYALRSSFGLLIQIPFFIAAYAYLSHLEVLRGSPFLFIRDLGAPDALITLPGAHTLNLLPLVMTAVNCASGAVYARGLALKEKLRLYGTAAVFLVLLYNSPAALVVYWTLNNLFSLAKNLVIKTAQGGKLVYAALFAAAACLDGYLIFFHRGDLPNRLLACAVFSTVFFSPWIVGLLKRAARALDRDCLAGLSCFMLSSLTLFTLTGLVIPGSLAASSVEEFSFIGSYRSPFPFLLHTMTEALGIWVLWAAGVYFLFSRKVRRLLTLALTLLSFWACVNAFLVSENFGFLTNTLIFSEPKSLSAGSMAGYLVNLGALAAAGALILYLFFSRRKRLLFSLQSIVLVSVLGFAVINLARIQSSYTVLEGRRESAGAETEGAFFTLSKTGKNVMLFMLDAAVSGYVPYIFEEKPSLNSSFKDFTWYPNCVSFANHTMAGAPPIYGGYEYTPEAINKRDTVPLADKHREAYLLLPLLFSDAGYSVTVTDPPFDNYTMSNLSIFAEYPQIRAENIGGKYTSLWLDDHPAIRGMNIAALLRENLIRFSFFKISPLFLRYFLYNDGNWLSTENLRGGDRKNALTATIINDYALLDLLPRLTEAVSGGSTYTAIYAHLPHDEALLQLPDYLPSDTVENPEAERRLAERQFAERQLADDSRYHINMASFLLMEKFIRYLQEEGLYDNTRIILVADHGRGDSDYPNNIPLPDGSTLQSYNPLLMVKDFTPARGEAASSAAPERGLKIDDSFMTNADTVFFALDGLIADPVNPFTREKLKSDKAEGAKITTIGALSSYRHGKYRYTIRRGQWMRVRENIFDPANWSPAED